MSRKLLIIPMISIVVLIFGQHTGSFEFGKKMYEDGFLQEAKVVFERIITTSPVSGEAEESYLLLADIHTKNEEFIKAEEYYRVLFETFPSGRFREEALFRWANSQYNQKRYSQALETYNRFIQTFPASLNRLESLYLLIDCHYNLNNFSRVIAIGRDYLDANPNNPRTPDLMLLMAKSYLYLNNTNDGENTLDLIIQRYGDSDARWESSLIKVDLLIKQAGEQRAIDELLKHLNAPRIPRRYEEKIRKKLTDIYLESNNHQQALVQLRELISKFDRSEQLAEYLYHFATINIESGDYRPVLDLFEKFDQEIEADPYYFDLIVRMAEIYFNLNMIEETEEILLRIEDFAVYGVEPEIRSNKYALNYWKARVKENRGQYFDAIRDYQLLLNIIPNGDEWRDEVLMNIGDIYLEKLRMYPTAVNYYNQIVTGGSASAIMISQSFFRMAMCYENMGEYSQAINSLEQVNIGLITSARERENIVNMLELLHRFKKIDYERSTSKLMLSMVKFLEDDNKSRLRNELINIILYDMKDVQSVLYLLEKDTSPLGIYTKGKAYLLAIQRSQLEKGETRSLVSSLEEVVSTLKQSQQTQNKVFADELDIDLKLIRSNYALNSVIVSEIEKYLNAYPQATAVNQFSFLAGQYYLKDRLFVRADEYLQKVEYSSDISITEYKSTFNSMAAYFFENDRYDKAITYYQQIEQSFSRPDDMYRYAVSLIKNNQAVKGIEYLNLLVKNISDFYQIDKAIDFLADYYRERSEYLKVVNTLLLLPDEKRTATFYQNLSQGYLNTGNKQKAKESLMYITDKSNEVLRNLAKLHYETDDLIMAEITYQELIKTEQEKRHRVNATAMLGHIFYIKENWQKAVTNYEKVLDDLGDGSSLSNLSITQVAQETAVSLYRLNNRPRAEAIVKRFKNALDNKPEALSKIELSEGIYQMTVNRNRAERSFSDIIRNRNYTESIKFEAYFWRGLNYLEVAKVDDALKDFQQAIKTDDINLRNQALLKLGTISFSKEQYQQSLDYYYRVIQEDISGVLALDAAKNFAIVCKTIEEWQKAIEAYQIILDRGGEGKLEGETIFNIAYCQFRDRKYNDAIPMFERSITLLNDREMKAEAQYWIGESYSNLGEYERASTEYLKVSYYYPDLIQWSAVAEIKLSEVYIRQGRVSAAKTVLERIISKYGSSSDWGRQAVVLLEQL